MSDELFARLRSTNRLPSPPGVALKILELSRSDDASLDDMAKAISTDPALAGRILKFVNSPTAGMGRRIASMDEAVNQLGMRGVTLMALSFSLVSAGKVEVCPEFSLERFWSRSLASAVAAKRFAVTVGRMDPNEAFIMGLLLRIGQLAMACAIPDAYETVLEELIKRPQDLLAIEKEKLGATHLEAGACLLESWRLPDGIWRTIAEMGQPMPLLKPGVRVPPVRILHMAEVTARLLCDSKEQRAGAVEEVLRLARETFELDEKAWSELHDELIHDWKAYGQVLSVKAGTELSFRDLQDEAREQIAVLTLATQVENIGIREQNQILLKRSRIDALTGVANRAAFDERLAGELERARRTQRPLVVCMLDVDHFKQFNDSFGHQAGDVVLQVVAKALDDAVRKMDFVARYGGEEFAVIAPECNLGSVASLAERLRLAVAEAAVDFEGRSLRVTASVGIGFAQWPNHPKEIKDLLRSADLRLYEAKRAGRNLCRFEAELQQAA